MTWQPELDELRRREAFAQQMGGPDKVKRQHDGGRLTIRERIAGVIDPGSFHEVGAIAGKAEYDAEGNLVQLVPSNCVFGRGKVDGRPVVVVGDDFTVRGGSADATIKAKPIMAEQMAAEFRLPIIRIIEGSGGGGSVKTIETTGRANLPGGVGGTQGFFLATDNMSQVPVVGLGLGSVAGLGAARLAASHYSIMTKETSAMFVAGPPVVNAPGPQRSPSRSSAAGKSRPAPAASTTRWTARRRPSRGARQFLSYLPSSVHGVPPVQPCDDDPERRDEKLMSVIPRDRRKVYKMRADHRHGGGPGQLLRDGPQFRPLGHHRARAPRRASGGTDGQRPLPLRRRLDGRCLPEGGALRRPRRNLPPAGRLPHGLPGLPDRAGGRTHRDDPPRRARDGGDEPDDGAVVHDDRAQLPSAWPARRTPPAGRLALRYAWLSGWWGSLPLEGGIEAAYRADIEARGGPEGEAARDRDTAEQAALAIPHRRDLLPWRRSSTRATPAACCANSPASPSRCARPGGRR